MRDRLSLTHLTPPRPLFKPLPPSTYRVEQTTAPSRMGQWFAGTGRPGDLLFQWIFGGTSSPSTPNEMITPPQTPPFASQSPSPIGVDGGVERRTAVDAEDGLVDNGDKGHLGEHLVEGLRAGGSGEGPVGGVRGWVGMGTA